MQRTRLVAILGLALLLGSGTACAEAPSPRTPFLGLEAIDPTEASHVDPERLRLVAGAGPLLARSAPVAWGAVEPRAPVMGGRHLHDWEALDRFVRAWQTAGADPVLVLSPASPWASSPAEDSAWIAVLGKELPETEAAVLVQEATGATPPRKGAWEHWERYVHDLVERYDHDGTEDAPGLLRRVAWVQVVERPTSPQDWVGSAAEYARLLHHATLGAARATLQTHVVHGLVDLDTLGHDPAPDRTEIAHRLRLREVWWPKGLVLQTHRALDFVGLTLAMDDLFEAVPHAGSDHLADEIADVGYLGRLLAAGEAKHAEVWLAGVRTPRLGEPRVPGVRGPDAAEQRLRARWSGAAKRATDTGGERGLARGWLERGLAFDVVRGVGTGLSAGATRVFLGGPDVFVAPKDGGGWRRTPAWYALRQTNRLLAGQVGAEALRPGRDVPAWRFTLTGEGRPPWVLVACLDPDVTWSGDPRLGPPSREVVLAVPEGHYVVEQIALDDGEPKRRRVRTDGGALRLELLDAPVWVYPDL